ncbi:MAG: Ig-like domain-containing protein [Acetivibrio sp.]
MKVLQKKVVTYLMMIVMMITVVPGTKALAATETYLNMDYLTIGVKQNYQLEVIGTTKMPTWTSNNKKVATVNSKGLVKGIKSGDVTITAKTSGKAYSAMIRVVPADKMLKVGIQYKTPDGSKVKTETINGKKVSIIPKGTTFSLDKKTSGKFGFLMYNITQNSDKGKFATENCDMNGKYGKRNIDKVVENASKLKWNKKDEYWEADQKKTINMNDLGDYDYFAINISDVGGESTVLQEGIVTYYFKYK